MCFALIYHSISVKESLINFEFEYYYENTVKPFVLDTSSFSFLATTDNGLAYFKNNRLTDNFAILPRISEIKATYHFAENTVYFHANKQIYK